MSVRFIILGLLVLVSVALSMPATAKTLYQEKGNEIAFDPQEASFVRLLIHETQGGAQPCIDELELYGDGEENLALTSAGAKASASKSLDGYPIHKVEHLNDGQYGNSRSWVGGSAAGIWAQIALPQAQRISRVVFSRDRAGRYKDRMPTHVEVQLSLDGETWNSVAELRGRVPGSHGQKKLPNPSAPPAFVSLTSARDADKATNYVEQLAYACLGEEHAWLKTYGYADLSSRLVPYNGRVKEYPKHVEDDVLPLPEVGEAPTLDGLLEEALWTRASRGVARAAYPYELRQTPLMTHAVSAMVQGEILYLGLLLDPIASRHLAVVSSGDWESCILIKCSSTGTISFSNYGIEEWEDKDGLSGVLSQEKQSVEVAIPLARLASWEESGIRVGLCLGGKHTPKTGRAVTFAPAALAIRELDADSESFRVLLSNSSSEALSLRTNLPDGAVALAPGESRPVVIPAVQQAIGPEFRLEVQEEEARSYALQLFRYDPAHRVLALAEGLCQRLMGKGRGLGAEKERLAELKARHAALYAQEAWDASALRALYLEARLLKRDVFLQDPDLAPLSRLLFVKRQAFRPSHNYSVLLDSPWRPGGGIYSLDIPFTDSGLAPEEGRLTELFNAGEGIARNPMADFSGEKIYFGHIPEKDGFYHLKVMNQDGSGLKQLTEGPFHDYWPCPLPDGGLAFITTRCKARFLCWRPQAAVMFRMEADGSDMRPLSFANLSEWAPSVMADGRLIWTRSEYVDKGADFGHTLWSIRPDGTKAELVFGNTIIQPNGYANGREVPGTNEICCTLISHFGDLNGPIALVNIDQGRFNKEAITSITPEVPWPGMWPIEEAFRDPVPISKDLILCSHAPRSRFGLFVIDRFGNRELLHIDPEVGSMCPTVFKPRVAPPVIAQEVDPDLDYGEFVLADVYQGIEPTVERGRVKYVRVVEEVRADLVKLESGEYQKDHEPFMHFYASPVDIVNGPHGWPSYVAKTSHGIVPVAEDGSARFYAPAGKVLFFEILDENFTELQRMRSVVQLQPGEKRSCIGCHEHRKMAPPNTHRLLSRHPQELDKPFWVGRPFDYQEVVQPVLDAHCVKCHDAGHPMGLDYRGVLDKDRVPASYRNLISKGLVHYCDYGWNSGGCEKFEPLSFGTVKSRLWEVLNKGHKGVVLNKEEIRRIKTWIDLNCPLWPDYIERTKRPASPIKTARSQ